MSRVRDMRGGKDYESAFSQRMKGTGLWADLLKQRFHNAVRRLGLNERRHGILDMSAFVQAKTVREKPQLDLF